MVCTGRAQSVLWHALRAKADPAAVPTLRGPQPLARQPSETPQVCKTCSRDTCSPLVLGEVFPGPKCQCWLHHILAPSTAGGAQPGRGEMPD